MFPKSGILSYLGDSILRTLVTGVGGDLVEEVREVESQRKKQPRKQ